MTVNKADLIETVKNRLGVEKRLADNAVEAVLDSIQRAVAAGEKVALTGFGVFEKIERPARMGRNPATGAAVRVKKTSVPKFRAGTQFKGVVSGAVKLAKVTDAATKAAAKSTASSARTTARSAAAGPGKAVTAGRKAAAKAGRAPAKKTAAKKTVAKKTTAKKTTAKRTTKKAPARKAAKKG
jgi:DNA-binding protein HU-beta